MVLTDRRQYLCFDTRPVVEEASSLPWRPLDRVLAVRRLLWIIRRIVFILIYELSIGCRSQSVQSYAVAKSIFYFPVHTTDHTTKVSPVWFRTYTVSQSVWPARICHFQLLRMIVKLAYLKWAPKRSLAVWKSLDLELAPFFVHTVYSIQYSYPWNSTTAVLATGSKCSHLQYINHWLK